MGSRLLGRRVRERREALRLTQPELADLLKTDVKQILRWEKEQTDPGSSIVAALVVALRTSADYLFGYTDNPAPDYKSEDLSDEERQLILAVRNRNAGQAVRILANLTQDPK